MKPRTAAAAAISLLAALLALQSWAAGSVAAPVCNVQGRKANLGFVLEDLDGHEVRLDAYQGQVILLDFWATWCAPCKEAIPALVDLYRRYRERGLVVFGVSVSDSAAQLRPYASALRMNYPVLLGAGRDDLQDAFGPLFGLPTSLLITRDGAICSRHMGLAGQQQLEHAIQALL